jgi:hypothetical protein
MGQEPALIRPQNLKLYEPDRFHHDQQPPQPKTPNELFARKYPEQVEIYGSPLLELDDKVTNQVLPILINTDFFAGVLGGRSDLGHHVIYFEPEMQWYFKDSDNIYKPTTPEKLANIYRALMMKCAQDLPANVHKLNLFHEFRSDKVAKQITNRAKSILAADHTFFSATSPHQRIRGIELHERLILRLVETMLEPKEGSILTVTQAYQIFCQMSQQRSLDTIKRSVFRELMRDYVRGRFNLALRHDVPDSENKHQQAWKGLAVVEAETVA